MMFNSTFYNLARINRAAIHRPLKQVFGINNLALTIEINYLEYLFFEVPHRMIEVIKDLLRRLKHRPSDNLFLEKLPGHLLHQPDAKGAMGTNAIYLL